MTNSRPLPNRLICGLEIHLELKTNSKMFCACKNDPFFAPKPNLHTCPVCLGMPGGLPVANRKAIEWTIQLGLALGCQINLFSKFDRKHYFYPDLPKGYQISQNELPLCYDGRLTTEEGVVEIERIHLEEDTGKLLHTQLDGEPVSLIDFNRSGVPLVEIVTRPMIVSSQQAVSFAKKLRRLIRYLEISDADMEQGSFRLEANLSLQTEAQARAGRLPDYKVELKNINSFRFLKEAIEFDLNRQKMLFERGEQPRQETRGWDSQRQATIAQREKGSVANYRYFADPDLAPLQFTESQLQAWQKALPPLPEVVVSHWQRDFSLKTHLSEQLIGTASRVNWLTSLFVATHEAGLEANKVASLLVNHQLKLETGSSLKKALTEIKRLLEVTSLPTAELSDLIASVLAAHSAEVARYQAGEKKLFGYLLGQLRPLLPAQVDMNQVRAQLERALA